MTEKKKEWKGRTPVPCPTFDTKESWIWLLEGYGHAWFYLDDRYYFVFPEGAHKYGLCYGEDELTGNFPRWEFESEMAFLQAPLFKNGTCILDRLGEILNWEP